MIEKKDDEEQYELRETNARILFNDDMFSHTVCSIHEYMDYKCASQGVSQVLNFIQKDIDNLDIYT